jgi:hypothetical protein
MVALLSQLHADAPAKRRRAVLAAWGALVSYTVFTQSFVLHSAYRWVEGAYLPLGLALACRSLPPPAKREEDGAASGSLSQPCEAALLLVWLVVTLWAGRGGVRFWMFFAPVALIFSAKGIRFLIAGIFGERHVEATMRGLVGVSLLALLSGMSVLMVVAFSLCCILAFARNRAPEETPANGTSERTGIRRAFGSLVPVARIGGAVAFAVSFTLLWMTWSRTVQAENYQQALIWNRLRRPMLDDLRGLLPPGATTMAAWDESSALALYLRQKTIIDSEHFIPYWIFRSCRDVYGAKNPATALRYLRAHQADYLLLCDSDLRGYNLSQWIGSLKPGSPIQRLSPLTEIQVEKRNDGALVISGWADPDLDADVAARLLGSEEAPLHAQMALKLSPSRKTEPGGAERRSQLLPEGAYVRLVTPGKEIRGKVARGSAGGAFSPMLSRPLLRGTLIGAPPDGKSRLKWELYYVQPEEMSSLAVRLLLLRERLPGFELVARRSGYALWKIRYPKGLVGDSTSLAMDFNDSEKRLWLSW